jgi:hypothetical protein
MVSSQVNSASRRAIEAAAGPSIPRGLLDPPEKSRASFRELDPASQGEYWLERLHRCISVASLLEIGEFVVPLDARVFAAHSTLIPRSEVAAKWYNRSPRRVDRVAAEIHDVLANRALDIGRGSFDTVCG